MELSEILGGAPAPEEPAVTVETKPEPVETPPEQPATTAEQTAERARDERGRFIGQQEPVAQPATPEERQPHMVPVTAMIEERRKRQELEARLAQLQTAPQVKDEEFWQAPVQTTQQLLGQHQQQVQKEIQSLKYELAEDLTRTLHSDYDAVRDEFIAMVHDQNPMAVAIAQQMGAQPNPAKFVYDQTKKLSALKIVGDPRTYEERIRADERAKLLIEMQQQGRTPPPVPRSLNSEPSAPSPSTPDSFEPTPIGALFERPF